MSEHTMAITEIPRASCPNCSYQMDRCTGISDEDAPAPGDPAPGDLSVCAGCGTFLTFDDELRLQLFPDDQLIELPDETRLLLTRARSAITEMRAADG